MNTRSPFLSPPEASPLLDNGIDIAITRPRHDSADDGRVDGQRTLARSPGPRQRRFDFDSKVIRDTVVMKLRSIEREDLAAPLDACHRIPVYKQCANCHTTKVFYNRCDRVGCPICAARLARDRRESVDWWRHCIGQPKHVVLTSRSVRHLSKRYIREQKDRLRRLRAQRWAKEGEFQWKWTDITLAPGTPEPIPGHKRRRGKLANWEGKKRGIKSTKWRGGFWSLDATWHPDVQPGERYSVDGEELIADELIERGWHVHFHAIIDADFIDQDKLSREWAKLNDQDIAVVRVYDVRGKDYVAEACRYVADGMQVGQWPPEKLAEFLDTFSEERTFDTFGALYKQRAEWSAFKEEMHAERDVCKCGCSQWRVYDENEWEASGCKDPRPPPPTAPRKSNEFHPELFNSSGFGVR